MKNKSTFIFSQTVRVGSNFAKIGKNKIQFFTISALSKGIKHSDDFEKI
jgi:hypothetical protein